MREVHLTELIEGACEVLAPEDSREYQAAFLTEAIYCDLADDLPAAEAVDGLLRAAGLRLLECDEGF